MKRKVVSSLFIVLSLMVISLASWMVYIVEYRVASGSRYTYVVDANPSFLEKKILPPYSGVHPRMNTRPVDYFSYPIKIGDTGPVKPVFAGELQYPFFCGVVRSRLGQPLVDNHEGYGVRVFDVDDDGTPNDKVLGYSQDCLVATRAEYFYKRQGTNGFYPLDEAEDDIEKIVSGDREIEFVVRLETGTINRFIYTIAVLRGENETAERPDPSHWNKRLVYQFRGGVGIGHKQGHIRKRKVLRRRMQQLKDGYAVVYSTANQTSNHYNIWLAEDTALRVKKQFVSLYGEPDYTVGIGGSGGAIQQYLIGQNNPQLLDAIIPLYSYPDMITQTINILDCELQEYYFDVTDRENQRWGNWENRSLVQGFNATAGEYHDTTLMQKVFSTWDYGHKFDWNPGKTECASSWRPMGSLVHNPRYYHYEKSFAPELFEQVDWTHWDDVKSIYGTDDNGNALDTWDNVGVQYGLLALKEESISVDEFIKLNAKIGSWKPRVEMDPEKYWVFAGNYFPIEFSVWGEHNMRLSVDTTQNAAPRSRADLRAIEAAYRSGMLFVGEIDIPIVDIRHYLEPELDMHHSIASFSSRQRIANARGDAANHVIWMAERPYNPTQLAFRLLDQWINNIKSNPRMTVADAKPHRLNDACFTGDGGLVAIGEKVWDGTWNHADIDGECQAMFPSFMTPRQVAGAGVTDDVFKCGLQSVAEAIEAGVYGDVDVHPYGEKLERLFSDGVCDYGLPDQGRPVDLWQRSRSSFVSIGERAN